MFIPYHSAKGTVDLTEADREFCKRLEVGREKMRRITTRWVPSLQFISAHRKEMHWCSYDDGRVVAFCELTREESFADLEDVYEFISAQVRHIKSLGNYKGEFIDQPDPLDDPEIHWRKWNFKAGDSLLELNVGFMLSQFCRIVEDGTETITVTKKRVICGDPVLEAA